MKRIIYITLLAITIFGCKKQDEFLDVKRNKSDVTPQTLNDYQALLDNYNRLNYEMPVIGAVGTDNYYLTDADLNTLPETERNAYLWNKDIWVNGNGPDWNNAFRNIEYANVVLNGLEKINPANNTTVFNNVKGQAFFYRAFVYYHLAQLFCKPFVTNTAATDLGLPLRTSDDVNIIYKRATVQETYAFIIADLKSAIELLPSQALYNTRANKNAALALMAKVYLAMEDYENAFTYADWEIKGNPALLDYNSTTVSATLTYRFPANGTNNPEVLYYAHGGTYTSIMPTTSSKGYVNPDLYKSYSASDLRKTLFYLSTGNDNTVRYRGSYTGASFEYCGLANNEIYLIRAECLARSGKYVEAMSDLNALLKNRFKAGQFIPYIATSADDALSKILMERRKELPFIGNLRWEDLRRLNHDARFAANITRINNGTTNTLVFNSPKYVLPIPELEIGLSGIEQNQR